MFRPTLLAIALLWSPSPDAGSTGASAPAQGGTALGEASDTDGVEPLADTDPRSDEPLSPESQWVEPQEVAEPRPNLRVLAAGHPPFVVAEGGDTSGIALEIWEDVAAQAKLDYQVQYVDDVPDAVELLAAGKADVLIGPISITAQRAQQIAFTQPYHHAALSLLAREGSAGLLARFRPFVTQAFLVGVGALMLILTLVGTLLWLTERKHNEDHFPGSALRGIGNGIWLALVTMTTVGYGDRVPLSTGGRVVAGVWMVISMVTASSLTASIATALTLSGIGSGAIGQAGQLAQQRVATVRDTRSAAFVRRHRGRLIQADDIDAAIAAVEDGDAVCVVYDRPILRNYLAENPDSELVLSEATYEPHGYGFALVKDTVYLERVNIALLKLAETGRIDELINRTLGDG